MASITPLLYWFNDSIIGITSAAAYFVLNDVNRVFSTSNQYINIRIIGSEFTIQFQTLKYYKYIKIQHQTLAKQTREHFPRQISPSSRQTKARSQRLQLIVAVIMKISMRSNRGPRTLPCATPTRVPRLNSTYN